MNANESDLEVAIQFARHNFDSHQALIRSSDTKAGVTATVMVFLAASALQVSKEAVAELHVQPCLIALSSAVFLVAAVGMFLSVLWTFWTVHKVLRPRGARYTSAQKGRDLLWQDHVLLHESNEAYFLAVRAASQDLVLRNLTDQIFELAHISNEKMRALTYNREIVWIGFVSWVCLITSALVLVRY